MPETHHPVRRRLITLLAVLLLLPGLASAQSAAAPMPSLAPLVEEVSPSVVNIATRGTVEAERNPLMEHPFFRRFFDEMPQPRERQVQSLGSGVIVDADEGYVLTNHHVIANADEITVSLQDERTFEAEVIGSDPETDIAVIRIDADNLEAVTLGDSSELRTGDYVMALGNPFGLDHTVTSGIVSGLGRSLGPRASGARIQDFIQTDASINPGNSGGALVNLEGELVGINTAILSRSGGNIGIGFAVPVNMAETVMQQIIEYGEVRRGQLGVRVQDVTPALAEAMGLETGRGALVAQVSKGSPADEAGLQAGDVITAVDDESVDDASDLGRAIGLKSAGSEVTLSLMRDGESREITATLGERTVETDDRRGGGDAAALGLRIVPLDDRHPLAGELDRGVVVAAVSAESPAAGQLRQGDVITSVNRQPVASPADFRRAVEGESRLLLRVHRGEAARFIVIER
ncbi:DegQ family serine endoprotease [Sediminicurvatus halobius]|uniref:Serine endoprotease DegQ n=1 Tax=Sediminicurvatus halobius TaxID=2182432 RepID=A0A2U2N9L8_9GAMM|nr:DegQ family serine endoprotease [Spiribacter halobius]PWG65782.1 serine endoprotease DegQ [Spiribacter halobius]UEX77823.1 DegQ family serine endoprotease [Spiribacter halobius]